MNFAEYELNRLLVYRNLLKNEIINEFKSLLSYNAPIQPEHTYALAAKLIEWAEETGMNGNLAQNYLIWQIAHSETVFSAAVEKYQGKIRDGLFRSAVHDIAIFKNIIKSGFQEILPDIVISNYKSGRITDDSGFAAIRDWFLSDLDPQGIVENLINHYKKYGCGDMAIYRAFCWDKERGLVKVAHVDPVTFNDIIGYDYQKRELIANTEAFLAGRMANNVLLSGARGTGKSSSIKALVNHFFANGLRLADVKKEDFKQLPQIMNTLRSLNKKFIVLLDDLSFEDFETDYKHLKSLIDGGMQTMPDNVLLYATSNRRHLVRETWHDRAGDEINSQDTVNEKISLSDRFGITIHYPSPTQEEYLNIIKQLAKKNDIVIEEADLKKEALQWEMLRSGRSGRVAKQFIAYFAGQKNNGLF